MNNNEQLITDLHATRDRMTPENWCPHGAIDPQGRRCVLLHLQKAIGFDGQLYRKGLAKERLRYRAAYTALNEHAPQGYNAGSYNDLPTTTFHDIVGLIDKTLADHGGITR